MEGLVLLLALLVFAVPIASIILAAVARSHTKALRDELQAQTEEKTRQLQSLWREVNDLKAKLEAVSTGAPSWRSEQPATPPIKVEVPTEPTEPTEPWPPQQVVPPLTGAAPIASKPVVPSELKPPAPPPKPVPPPTAASLAKPLARQPIAVPPPAGAARVATPAPTSPLRVPSERPSLQARMKNVSSIEEMLGTNWLLRIGIVIITVGLAFFGAYEVHTMGPMARVATLYTVAFAFLGFGISFEKRERYRLIGYGGIGAGWALLFFCAYAMHHLAAMRVLDSEPIDLVAMLVVAVGMAAHTLRYRSQFVTGLGFLLGYATVAISHDTVYSLSAGVILAIGLVLIVLKMSWFELEIFGILAGYLNHLYRLLGPEGAHGRAFPQYHASLAMLLFFWLTFRISYIVRKIQTPSEERISTIAALFNTLLLLGIMKFQSVQPELAYMALFAVGGLEFALAQLPITRRRREAFVILTVLGSALILTAVPMHWDSDVALLWVAGAEAFLIAGIVVKEVLFRRLGLLTGLLIAGRLALFDFPRLMSQRSAAEAAVLSIGLTFAVCAGAYYLNFVGIGTRNREFFEEPPDRPLLVAHGYLGAFAAAAAVWALFGANWQLGPAFLAAGIALALLARKWEAAHLCLQENAFAAGSVLATIVYGLNQDPPDGLRSVQMTTVALVAAGLYAISRFSAPRDTPAARPVAYVHTLAATGLLTYLAWVEVSSGWLAAVWAIFALGLAAIDRRFGLDDLRWQAHGLAALAMVRCLAVNLYVTETWHGVSIRLLSVAAVAIVLYSMSRLVRMPEELREREFHHVYSWFASVLVSLLIWYEVQPLGIAVGWGAFGLVLFEYGFLRAIRQLRWQANVAFAASFVRIFFVNLTAGVTGEIWGPRVYTVLPLAMIYFFVYSQEEQSASVASEGRGKLLAWLGTGTIVAFLYFHVFPEWVATALAVLVFVLLGAALALHRKVFLHQALVLCGFVVARGASHNLFGSSYFENGGWQGRFLVLGSAVAVLLAAMPLAYRLRAQFPAPPDAKGVRRWLAVATSRPEQLLFFASFLLLTVMLMLKMDSGMVTVSWGVEGVAIVLFGLAMKERSFRLAGLALFLVCVAKILVLDIWGLEARDRWITLIVVGAALVGVSILYSKYREAMRQLL